MDAVSGSNAKPPERNMGVKICRMAFVFMP